MNKCLISQHEQNPLNSNLGTLKVIFILMKETKLLNGLEGDCIIPGYKIILEFYCVDVFVTSILTI